MWNTLSSEEQNHYVAIGFSLFPEVFAQRTNAQYQRYVLWLATHLSVINHNVRDSFTAGGNVEVLVHGVKMKVSSIFYRVRKLSLLIQRIIEESEPARLKVAWNVKHIEEDRMEQWIDIVSSYGQSKTLSFNQIRLILNEVFHRPQKIYSLSELKYDFFLPWSTLRLACGSLDNEQLPEITDKKVACRIKDVNPDCDIVATAVGESMDPRVRNGDMVVVRLFEKAKAVGVPCVTKPGGLVVVSSGPADLSGSASFALKILEGKHTLKSLNPEFPPIELEDGSGARIIGSFLGVIR